MTGVLGASRSAARWGPGGHAAAVSITLDNLGEAMDLSIGTWPEGRPVGRHHSVTEVLPRILDLLRREGVSCTYFVEGWSAEVYPEVLRRLDDAGHEIALHGWRHEHWPALTSRRLESQLISRGMASMRAHGVDLRGFRPPGGVLTPWSVDLLGDNGFTYVSPAGRRAGLIDGLVALPFRWTAIDAYYFFDAFAPLRRMLGDPAGTLPPERLVAGVEQALDEVAAAGGCLSLLFHPFLEDHPDRFEAMAHIVGLIAGRDDIWCAPCAQHADWALEHRELLSHAPQLDEASWQ